jgi:hypothetical protein
MMRTSEELCRQVSSLERKSHVHRSKTLLEIYFQRRQTFLVSQRFIVTRDA